MQGTVEPADSAADFRANNDIGPDPRLVKPAWG